MEVTQIQSKQQINYLKEEKISKLMLKFSIPCILSLLASAFYNIVDQIFIGNSELSALGNAATGVVFPIFIIAQAFAWCFGDSCAAILTFVKEKRYGKCTCLYRKWYYYYFIDEYCSAGNILSTQNAAFDVAWQSSILISSLHSFRFLC